MRLWIFAWDKLWSAHQTYEKFAGTKCAVDFTASVCFCTAAQAQNLDVIGVTLLRAVTTNLNGSGVRVGQPEATDLGSPPYTNTWEVNPGAAGVSQPTNLFTWIKGIRRILLSARRALTQFARLAIGACGNCGGYFYGIPNGVATNVAHVDNYDATTFYYHYVEMGNPISERIVNQVSLSAQTTRALIKFTTITPRRTMSCSCPVWPARQFFPRRHATTASASVLLLRPPDRHPMAAAT